MAESEDVLVILHVAERLMKTHPQLDTGVVAASVQTAYEELRYARVRTYLPVLMERRARDLLSSDEQTPSPCFLLPDCRKRLVAARRDRAVGLQR
ncbi:three-helix bundle dimerization domain-containing protein [Streptomyces goshikiensis]|uniref:three-helix bundle dimerization domain-containing protein n=1 Tax=Streptomyces goshikiensis TaxID=1942 RepID=UPI003696296E